MGTGTLDSTATPRVSMVMPVHNGARWLADAIESVLAQDFGDFELILVDDASRDGSPAIMADAAARDPRVRRLRLDANVVLPAALTQGLSAARGARRAVRRGKEVYGRGELVWWPYIKTKTTKNK